MKIIVEKFSEIYFKEERKNFNVFYFRLYSILFLIANLTAYGDCEYKLFRCDTFDQCPQSYVVFDK